MKRYDCIFLDRDGTINPDPGYIKTLDEFNFFSYTISALIKLSQYGNRFCIASNQSGISRGLIKKEDLNIINLFIKSEFEKNNIPLLDIYIAIDHPDKNPSIMRKPGSGMFLKARDDHGINLKNSLIIGDSYADMEAGRLLNMDRMLVLSGLGTETLKKIHDNNMPNYIVKDLKEGAINLCQ